MSINSVTLLGHTGKKPEYKKFESGSKKVTITLATNSKYTDKKGKLVETTQWHRVIAWGPLAAACKKYVGKGSKIAIQGRLETRTYEVKGDTRWITEVIATSIEFCDSKKVKSKKKKEA